MKAMFICRPSSRLQRGVAAVEFALTFPLLVLLTIGIFEFSRAIWVQDSLREALNVTGRYAMYNPAASNDQLQTYFGQNIQAVSGDTVNLVFSNSTTGTVTFTTITASYNYVPTTGIVPLSVQLTSATRIPRI